jgi:predicted SAM-dependent methyltransferase
MRLVSQNGEFDVPYEIASLSRTGNIIRAYIPMVGEKGTVMAHYSTEEKAEKAMEMLRNTYTGAFFAQNIEITEDIEKEFMKMASTKGFGIIKTMVNSPDIKFEPANIAFRFPKDDEV